MPLQTDDAQSGHVSFDLDERRYLRNIAADGEVGMRIALGVRECRASEDSQRPEGQGDGDAGIGPAG